jgi:hypothetical protein
MVSGMKRLLDKDQVLSFSFRVCSVYSTQVEVREERPTPVSAVQRKHGKEISESGLQAESGICSLLLVREGQSIQRHAHARMLENAGSRGRGGCVDGEDSWEEAELGEVQEGL